jgi:hypothetical protein
MARAFRKSGLLMGERATRFYAEDNSAEAVATRGRTVRIGMSAGLVRLLVLIALPIAVAIVALLTDRQIDRHRWLTAWILLIVSSQIVTLAWLAYRRWRRHHAADS